ncbi:uncharacterized protein LOC105441054 [Strongylocentrotus purpuratus]|uniref:Uncharacterized protein n=1 Tax=Strongylocentrotus purpuratus TaxID=7668 RepID=A0A7M7PDI4_STRPU|nr:uncharacterized protein LOC105441054 [Strongylocentrotus purpuratus]
MEKCFVKPHSVFQLLLILWMTSLIHIAVGDFFPCSGSNINVSVTLVCNGYYDCDNYEDESSCNYSATYLQEGESHIISLLPDTRPRGLYNATLIQTNATNGFQVVFKDLLLINDDLVQIGTGNDPSDIQSVIATIHGYRYQASDIYINSNEMWFAAIIGWQYGRYRVDVGVTAIDMLNLFPCSGSNMNVSVTLVCDGYYNCDNYEDESSCNYSTTYLQEGESHIISLPLTTTSRLHNVTLIQTNAKKGFHVVIQYLYLANVDLVQIGTGDDPSDINSVITTIHGPKIYADDIYVHSNEIWFAAIGGLQYSRIRMDVGVTAIDLLNFFPCSGSNMNVSVTLVCDGYYDCDNYEDESSCSK